MKVTIKKTIRNLIEGSEFHFEKNSVNILLGKNGSGKSTLFKAIRGSFEQDKKNDYDINADDNFKLSKHIQIEHDNPEKIKVFFFLSKEDDPINQLDAFTSIQKGLFKAREKSEGEKFAYLFAEILSKIKNFRDKNLQSNQNADIFVGFDEVDSHFEMTLQKRYIIAIKKFAKEYNTTFLVITHHLGTIIREEKCIILDKSNQTTIMSGIQFFEQQ